MGLLSWAKRLLSWVMMLIFPNSRWAREHSLCELYTADHEFDHCNSCGGDEKNDVVAEKPSPTIAVDGVDVVLRPSITDYPEPRTYDSSTKKGVLFGMLLDQPVELSLGCDKKLNRSEIVKAKSFDELNFPSRLVGNVVRAGYSKPTPIQQYTMGSICEGRDLIACSPSGTGKTAAYLVPILSWISRDGVLTGISKSPCMPRALILVPTRELAIQIHQVATMFAARTFCKCEIFYGGVPVRFQRERISKGVSLLIGTVDRIKQFVNEGIISLERTKFLVLDEADRIFDAGLQSSLDLQFIMRKGKIPPRDQRQTLLFSATFPSAVKERVERSQILKDDYLMVVVDKIGAANKCIIQDFVQVKIKCEKKDKLLDMIRDDMKKYEKSKDTEIYTQKTLIFVTQQNMADMLELILSQNGIPVTTIHAGHIQAHRESALDKFRLGKTPVLVATAVIERGIDIMGVDHVINFDMPQKIDDYVYRIGRTGRIGNIGRSTSFIDRHQDDQIIEPLINLLNQAEQIVPDWLNNMRVVYQVRERSSEDDYAASMSSPYSSRRRPRTTM